MFLQNRFIKTKKTEIRNHTRVKLREKIKVGYLKGCEIGKAEAG